jgi:hypothetical protein
LGQTRRCGFRNVDLTRIACGEKLQISCHRCSQARKGQLIDGKNKSPVENGAKSREELGLRGRARPATIIVQLVCEASKLAR